MEKSIIDLLNETDNPEYCGYDLLNDDGKGNQLWMNQDNYHRVNRYQPILECGEISEIASFSDNIKDLKRWGYCESDLIKTPMICIKYYVIKVTSKSNCMNCISSGTTYEILAAHDKDKNLEEKIYGYKTYPDNIRQLCGEFDEANQARKFIEKKLKVK